MDFAWSDDVAALAERTERFARTELADDPTPRDQTSTFWREGWERCARAGIQSMAVPAAYNASGDDTAFLAAVRAMEALGRGCPDNGLPFALNTHMWTVTHPIHAFGTDEQRERFLRPLCSGERIGCHALTEPDSGSDGFSLRLHAERRGDAYVLTGRKTFISLAPVADLALVFATVDPSRGRWGITAFVVELDRPGVTRSSLRPKMGLRSVPMGDLAFDGCEVPASCRLGAEGAGVGISHASLEVERCAILASQLGAMERQLDDAVAHASSREQFGQPVGKFQSVSNRLVDMKLRLETARLLLYKTAWMKEQGRPAMLEAALLKLHLSESFVSSSLDAIRTRGGYGYLTENGVERDLRDAIGGLLYAGTSDIQRVIVARLLGL